MTTIIGWNAASVTRFATRPTTFTRKLRIVSFSNWSIRLSMYRSLKQSRSIVRVLRCGIRRVQGSGLQRDDRSQQPMLRRRQLLLMTLFLLFVATCFLAYSNGANDNFKGVASLFGSRTCTYRTAISWATITTFGGSIMSIFLAQALLKKFSAKGVVPDHFAGSEYFLLAVAIGAGLTVILATLTGFPISTTHALTGAIIGCGLLALGSQVNLAALGKGFVLPLLLIPVLAIAVAGILYIVFHALRVATGTTKEWCICVGAEERIAAMPQPNSLLALRAVSHPSHLTVDELENCRERYGGNFLGLTSQQVVDAAHFLSAGTVSFARGLNDTPKTVALLHLWKAL